MRERNASRYEWFAGSEVVTPGAVSILNGRRPAGIKMVGQDERQGMEGWNERRRRRRRGGEGEQETAKNSWGKWEGWRERR